MMWLWAWHFAMWRWTRNLAGVDRWEAVRNWIARKAPPGALGFVPKLPTIKD